MKTPPTQTPQGVRLAGTGLAVPRKVVTNNDLAKFVDTSDEWITQRTGIRQRHMVEDGQTVRHLALDSLQQALRNANMTGKDLDMVLCATLTPEMSTPSTAARIVADIGAVPAGAVDISAACSGFVYGLNMGASLIKAGACRTVGVIGAETLTKIVDWKDRRTCVLFGDGAGAAVITASDDPQQGCLYQTMSSDGNAWQHLYCPRIEQDLPVTGKEEFSGAFNTLQMNGREVFKFAVHTLEKAIDDTLHKCGVKISDLAMIIPHQSNIRILQAARERLGLSEDKLIINIDRYANTSAASVPICLHEQVAAGKLKPGDLVLFVAIGGGMTWATSLWRW